MAEYLTRDAIESVDLNTPISFVDSIPCTKGYIFHQSGSGIFILRGIVNNPCAKFARYSVTFTGNIAIPTGGAVSPIATVLKLAGGPQAGSRSIFTPAAVDQYGNVTSSATIDIPAGCCFTMTVDYVSGVTDGTTTPTPTINVIDGKLEINRVA